MNMIRKDSDTEMEETESSNHQVFDFKDLNLSLTESDYERVNYAMITDPSILHELDEVLINKDLSEYVYAIDQKILYPSFFSKAYCIITKRLQTLQVDRKTLNDQQTQYQCKVISKVGTLTLAVLFYSLISSSEELSRLLKDESHTIYDEYFHIPHSKNKHSLQCCVNLQLHARYRHRNLVVLQRDSLSMKGDLINPYLSSAPQGQFCRSLLQNESLHEKDLVIPVTVDGIQVKALLDTGSTSNVISSSFVKKHKLSTITLPKPAKVTFANGHSSLVTHQAIFEVRCKTIRCQVRADVFDIAGYDLYIGVTGLRTLNISIEGLPTSYPDDSYDLQELADEPYEESKSLYAAS